MPLRQLTPSLRVVRGQTQTRTNENLCYILVRVVRFLRRVSCLQDLKQPFKDDLLPPAPFAGTRTLVLDLEDTLVHYEWDVRTPTSLLVTTRPALCELCLGQVFLSALAWFLRRGVSHSRVFVRSVRTAGGVPDGHT